jgi:hypothetical protein
LQADTGNLTVYINGQRRGFANHLRWMGEIKGELCWMAALSYFDSRPPDVSAPTPRVSVQLIRRPPPRLTPQEAHAEAVELQQMAEMQARKRVERRKSQA